MSVFWLNQERVILREDVYVVEIYNVTTLTATTSDDIHVRKSKKRQCRGPRLYETIATNIGAIKDGIAAINGETATPQPIRIYEGHNARTVSESSIRSSCYDYPWLIHIFSTSSGN